VRSQRGIIATGWLYLGGAIAILALISALVYGVKSYLDGVDQKGYDRGKQETEAKYAKRDNEQLRAAAERIKTLEDQARRQERENAERLAEISKQRQKELADAKRQHDRDIAAVRAGTLKLHDPGVPAGGAAAGRGSPGPAPGAPAGGRDGETRGQLSGAAAEFLLGLAGEADDVARQLDKAQAVIIEYRRACNQ